MMMMMGTLDTSHLVEVFGLCMSSDVVQGEIRGAYLYVSLCEN